MVIPSVRDSFVCLHFQVQRIDKRIFGKVIFSLAPDQEGQNQVCGLTFANTVPTRLQTCVVL